MVNYTNPELVAKLRAALRETTGDERLDEMMHGSILAALSESDTEMIDVWDQEAGPEQAEVDLHLGGPGVEGHTTNAKLFAELVSGISQAVKETAKHRAGKGRYSEGIVIEGATPGSVRLVLRAPKPRIDSGQTADAATSASSVDSDALRSVAAILTHASDPDPNSPLLAEIADLPLKAREGLKRIAATSKKAGWTIDGTLRQRRLGRSPIAFTSDGAARLVREIDARVERRETITVTGTIDGFRRSLGTLYFAPEQGSIFQAAVIDEDVANRVTELFARPDLIVEAEFDVVESQLPGSAAGSRKSRVLDAIRETDLGKQLKFSDS